MSRSPPSSAAEALSSGGVERAARLGRVHVIGVVARSAVCDAQPVRAHLGGGVTVCWCGLM